MARISGVPEQSAPPEVRVVYERVRKRMGRLVEPVTVTANHPEIFKAYTSYETAFGTASRISPKLKELAMLKVAALIGCPFCLDFGSAEAKRTGVSEAQIRELPRYSESTAFSDVEKLILDLVTAMTQTPVKVSDSLFSKLQAVFDPPQMVEITATIAWENYRSRFFHALGIESHGFSEGSYCAIAERKHAQTG